MTRSEDKVVYLSDYVYKHRDEQTIRTALYVSKARQALRHQLLCEKSRTHGQRFRLASSVLTDLTNNDNGDPGPNAA